VKAVVWHGKEDVRVDSVPDPIIQEPTDAIVRITSTAICGSDLHLYSKLGPLMREGDIIGHEPMGIVEEVGAGVEHIKPGDRVVVPFNISCGHCYFCDRQLYSQCETTRDRGKLAQTVNLLGRGRGASLFGYTHVYGAVPGGQAEYLRVPQAHFGPIKVPEGPPDERFLYLSDVLPTSWQAVAYAHARYLGARADRADVRPHSSASGSGTRHRGGCRPRAPLACRQIRGRDHRLRRGG
jgi:threonine dehydrogenase-like Zn-dependent dehydrogenase